MWNASSPGDTGRSWKFGRSQSYGGFSVPLLCSRCAGAGGWDLGQPQKKMKGKLVSGHHVTPFSLQTSLVLSLYRVGTYKGNGLRST